MEEGGTAVIANYINLNRCATTPWMLVLIFELLKSSLEWSQEQAMPFPECSMHSWARGGKYMVLIWKLFLGDCFLQRAKCSHNLLSSVALSNQRVLTWRDTLPLWKTPLCSLLKSLNFLGTACVLRWPRCMRRDADLAGATEQYQRQYPFRKGRSKPGWFNAREEMPALPRCSTAPSLFSSTLPPCGSQVEIQTDARVQEGGTSCRSFGCSLVQSCWQVMHMSLRKCLVPESIQLLMIVSDTFWDPNTGYVLESPACKGGSLFICQYRKLCKSFDIGNRPVSPCTSKLACLSFMGHPAHWKAGILWAVCKSRTCVNDECLCELFSLWDSLVRLEREL